MEQELIRRALPSEIKPDPKNGRRLAGFIPYDSPARIFENGRAFTEVIRPGAFTRSLAGGRDVLVTFNHNLDRLLGRTSSGTASITDAKDGLRYELELPSSAGDVAELLARGDLRGSSFTAFPHKGGDKWTSSRSGDLRELVSLELVELGPVVSPAYVSSEAEVRSGEPLPPVLGSVLSLALVRLMERAAAK